MKKLLIMGIIAVIAVGVIGCGKPAEEATETSTDVTAEVEVEAESSEEVTMETALRDIKIGNVAMEIGIEYSLVEENEMTGVIQKSYTKGAGNGLAIGLFETNEPVTLETIQDELSLMPHAEVLGDEVLEIGHGHPIYCTVIHDEELGGQYYYAKGSLHGKILTLVFNKPGEILSSDLEAFRSVIHSIKEVE